MKRSCIALVTLIVIFTALGSISNAQAPIWGPEQFVRSEGPPTLDTLTFTVPDVSWEYTLLVELKSADVGVSRLALDKVEVAGSAIWLNDQLVVSPAELARSSATITKTVTLQLDNEIRVAISGALGTAITISVIGPSTTEVIGIAGGTISVTGVGTLSFAAATFDSNQEVSMFVTSDSLDRIGFDATTRMYEAGPALHYEVRVTTGSIAPGSDCDISLIIPNWIDSHLVTEFELQAFIKFGDLGGFEAFPSTYDSTSHLLLVSVPPDAFSKLWNENGSYELVIVVGTTPQYWRD